MSINTPLSKCSLDWIYLLTACLINELINLWQVFILYLYESLIFNYEKLYLTLCVAHHTSYIIISAKSISTHHPCLIENFQNRSSSVVSMRHMENCLLCCRWIEEPNHPVYSSIRHSTSLPFYIFNFWFHHEVPPQSVLCTRMLDVETVLGSLHLIHSVHYSRDFLWHSSQYLCP